MPNSIIRRRQDKQKSELLEKLKMFPIVQVACEKSGVSRATFYRFRKDDEAFNKKVEEALGEGVSMMNDMAEANLLSSIRDKNMGGIAFWLKHRHPAYSTKVQVEATVRDLTLTLEQQTLVRRALELSKLTEGDYPHES
jgi:ACT domain-containing protein